MEQEDTIAFIYKREIVKNDEECTSMVYKLEKVLYGIELTDEYCYKTFVDKEGSQYSFINDASNLDSKYVYAFPEYVTGKSKEEIKRLLDCSNKEKESIEDYILYQILSSKDEYIQTYSIDSNNLNNSISINPYSVDGIYDILSDKYEEVEKTKKHIIEEKKKDIPFVVYTDELFDKVSKTVISQDDQIKTIASSIAKNVRITDPRLKDNLLVCGPSGVGKSEIFRCISSISNLPITIEDSTEYTVSGYKGKDVTDMLVNLYLNSDNNIEKAQRGIIVIDEIDKKISKREDTEVYSKAVLDSLLKMAEGQIYHVEAKNIKFDIDTSFITFAMLGAFSGIEEFNQSRRSLGFVTEEQKKEESKTKNSYTEQNLLKYGLKPEFLGRSKVVVMNNLDLDDFCKIINESDKSHLLLYKYLFKDLGINFIYDEATVEAIAKKAIELGVGARSIKKIIENALEVINYQIFSNNKYSELIISPETIEDNNKFILR